MGVSFSQILLGCHAVLEISVGLGIFFNGSVPSSMDPVESGKKSGTDKLWKRWHAAGLIAAGYVGYVGCTSTNPEVISTAVETSALFHLFAAGANVLGVKDGIGSLASATLLNIHFYFALGFGSVRSGLYK